MEVIILILSKAWDSYEADKRIEGFSPQTLKAYRLQAMLLIRYFNDVNIDVITTIQLKDYLGLTRAFSFLEKASRGFSIALE